MKLKIFLVLILSLTFGIFGHFLFDLTIQQTFILTIFSSSILGTLFFWEFRIGFVFIGSGIMLFLHATDLDHFVKFASLDVIWFLISMMIILAMLKDTGVFYYLTTKLLRIKNLNGNKLFLILGGISWLLSGLMGEVASILLIATIIFSLSEFLDISPIPLLVSCIITTNIGSATTVLGNPIGVLIALRGKLTFEDFIVHSLPVTFICLVVAILLLKTFYRHYISELTKKLKPHIENSYFISLISTPMEKKTKVSTFIFLCTIFIIAFHRRIEFLLDLEENTVLVITPMIIAGIVLILNHDKVIKYIEHEIEWNSLLFFLFLFAQAGVLQSSGIAEKIAIQLIKFTNNNIKFLPFLLLFSSGILSSVLDNVVVVTAYIP
ncbi:MAG: SLC13 family permease, partial [Endomicrobia bacterium]|nr:SLC13 family permease [Endomicrobiia bacterium]